MKKGNSKLLIRNLREMEEIKQLNIGSVSNSKADKREQAYQKYFRDDPKFTGRSYRLRDNYIWHKDEAYECIDYYLKTGIKPQRIIANGRGYAQFALNNTH